MKLRYALGGLIATCMMLPASVALAQGNAGSDRGYGDRDDQYSNPSGSQDRERDRSQQQMERDRSGERGAMDRDRSSDPQARTDRKQDEKGWTSDRDSQRSKSSQSKMGEGEGEDYVVEEGDTLAGIAEKKLGSADQWRVIARANQIDDPDDLEAGTRIKIPEDARRSGGDRQKAKQQEQRQQDTERQRSDQQRMDQQRSDQQQRSQQQGSEQQRSSTSPTRY